MGIFNTIRTGTITQCRIFSRKFNSLLLPENDVINRCMLKNSLQKFYSICKVKNIVRLNRLQGRNFSTEAKSKEESKVISKLPNTKKVSWIVPALTQSRIMNTTCITGIAIGTAYVSWVKISIENFNVLEWNAKVLPDDFRDQRDESSTLKLAYDVKRSIPPADLYVMETFSIKGREMFKRLNEIHLSSMLAVLLNGVNIGEHENEKVFFQKKFVLNNLHNLIVGSERICTREIVKNILCQTVNQDLATEDQTSDIYSSIEVQPKHIDAFMESYFSKQEDLSLVFLLTLSFINVNILQNEKSLKQIQRRVNKLKG